VKNIVDINWFGGALKFGVMPGKFRHQVWLYIKGLGEISLEFASEKMLAPIKDNYIPNDDDFGNPDEVMLDAYEELTYDWEEPE
jgi:hypothetical protein